MIRPRVAQGHSDQRQRQTLSVLIFPRVLLICNPQTPDFRHLQLFLSYFKCQTVHLFFSWNKKSWSKIYPREKSHENKNPCQKTMSNFKEKLSLHLSLIHWCIIYQLSFHPSMDFVDYSQDVDWRNDLEVRVPGYWTVSTKELYVNCFK